MDAKYLKIRTQSTVVVGINLKRVNTLILEIILLEINFSA